MLHSRAISVIILSLTSSTLAQNRGGGERGPNVPDFWVRPGYGVTLAAEKLPEARFIEFDDKGTLYLSQPGAGSITTLKQNNEIYEIQNKFITNKKTAHGMCWHDGWLYFSQSGAIHKARDTNN